MKPGLNNNQLKGPLGLVVGVVIFGLALAMLSSMTNPTTKVLNLDYSDFWESAESGYVESIDIAGDQVEGVLKSGEHFRSKILNNSHDLLQTLRSNGVKIKVSEPMANTGAWQVALFAAFVGFLIFLWFFSKQKGGGSSSGFFGMGRNKAKLTMPHTIKENFSSYVGSATVKDELKDIVDYLKNPQKYKKLGAKVTRGLLLVGEPGTGKTLLARALAGEANCPFFSVTGSDFIEVFVGVGAARVRDLFAQARKYSPAIIFIDEIDAIGRQRGAGLGGGNDEREQTLNQLLTEMDGFETHPNPVIVIAATNRPEILDKALLRPGRFDRRVDVPFPGMEDRKSILQYHTRKTKLEATVDLEDIAKRTGGYSGADLANLANEAALRATKNNKNEVTQEDFIASLQKVNDARSSGEQAKSGPRMYVGDVVTENFTSVAGAEEAKEELLDIVEYLRNPAKFEKLGGSVPRGVLLLGDPGNGKTLLARAIAGESGRPFFSAVGSDFVEVYVGQGASRVRDLFAQARKNAPSIVFIDEIDAVGQKRFATASGGSREHDQTLNQLLTEMDGFVKNKQPVIVIGATNRPDVLDSALRRYGRFGREVHVPYPDLKAREKIIRVHIKGKPIAEDVNLEDLARGTIQMSGADIAGMVNEAAIHASKLGKEFIDISDFQEARDKVILGKQIKSVARSKKELEMTAYHEAGHALINVLHKEADPLYKVTIAWRGNALGVAYRAPLEDKVSQTQNEMLASIKIALGGRMAEKLVYGQVTGGASSDLQSATHVARHMVCSLGMSDKLGLVNYDSRSFNYSQSTADLIDSEVRNIINECNIEVEKLLIEHRSKLDTLAKALLEKETVHGDEVYRMFDIELPEGWDAAHKLGSKEPAQAQDSSNEEIPAEA